MENLEKEKKGKLDTRDLITIGILSVVYIVIYIVIGLGLVMLGPIGIFISHAVASVILGTVVILLALKVQKFGVFLILAIMYGLFAMTTGFWWNILIYIAFGLVAELIASKGQYNKKINLALAFCIFQWGVVLASYFLIYLFKDSYIQIMLDLGLLSTLQEAQEHIAIFTLEALIIIIISNIIGQVLGVYIGLKVNKKHFEKAGMI